MKEPLVITHHQNKTLTPDGWQHGWGWRASKFGGGAGESERRRDRRTGGEGLEDTQETRRIHSGERCLSTVVNPLQGLVSCQTS